MEHFVHPVFLVIKLVEIKQHPNKVNTINLHNIAIAQYAI